MKDIDKFLFLQKKLLKFFVDIFFPIIFNYIANIWVYCNFLQVLISIFFFLESTIV